MSIFDQLERARALLNESDKAIAGGVDEKNI